MRSRLTFDFDAGILAALVGGIYTAAVCGVRGVIPGRLSGFETALLVGGFSAFSMIVGGVIAGRPDFGPTTRSALVRGFLATVPVYAAGGILFLPPEQLLLLLPFFSIAPAALVGPPIGIFMYRLHRRPKPAPDTPGIFGSPTGPRESARASSDSSIELAWQKGELLGSWTPLLVTVALFASFGLGTLAIEMADLELAGFRSARPPPPTVADRLPLLYERIRADSGDARARFELGVLLTSVGRFDEAVAELTHATRLDSTRVDHWRMLGRAAFYAQRADVAYQAYWNALRLDGNVTSPEGLDHVIWNALLNGTG